MDSSTVFQTFLRSTFGQDPGGTLGSQLRPIAKLDTIAPGDTTRIGSDQDRVIYMARGATKLVASASGEREQIVAFHFAGDLVSMPAQGIHRYRAIALTKATMLVFPASTFFDCIAKEADASRLVIERLRGALHRCRDKTVALGQKNAIERVSSFLLAMAERFGGTELNTCSLELPMSRREIGASLGLTIETVSRQITTLRNLGIISTEGRSQITLLDLEKLTGLCGRSGGSGGQFRKKPKFDSDQGRLRSAGLAAETTGGKLS